MFVWHYKNIELFLNTLKQVILLNVHVFGEEMQPVSPFQVQLDNSLDTHCTSYK